MAFRFDFRGPLTGIKQLGDGSLRVRARLARTGTQTYRHGPGAKPHVEYRSPAEVFAEAAVESAQSLTVTSGHPGQVTGENWRTHAIGHVGDDVRADGDYLAASLVIKDDAAIKEVLEGRLVEISCGYSCDVTGPGVTEAGEAYDAAQVNIRINHVALGPKGWGRAGSEVALRLDSLTADPDETPTVKVLPDSPADKEEKAEHAAAYTPSMTDEQIKALQAELAAAKGEASSAKADLANEKNRADSLTAAAESAARAVKVAEITALDPEFRSDGKESPEGLEIHLIYAARNAAVVKAAALSPVGVPTREDAADEDPVTTSRNAMLARGASAYTNEGKK